MVYLLDKATSISDNASSTLREIRRNLRIKEGDNLEVFIDNEDIILKKYSMMNKINDLAQELTDAIYTFTKHNVFITDSMEILNKVTNNEIYNVVYESSDVHRTANKIYF